MAHAKYPNLRNYEKRCELETLLHKLRELKKAYAVKDDAAWERAFSNGASDAEFEALEAAECEHREKINAKIKAATECQMALEFPSTRNTWFTEIVNQKGAGTHYITDRQYDSFLQYCERDPREYRSEVVHRCRVGNYFVSLHSAVGGKWMTASVIPDIRHIAEAV